MPVPGQDQTRPAPTDAQKPQPAIAGQQALAIVAAPPKAPLAAAPEPTRRLWPWAVAAIVALALAGLAVFQPWAASIASVMTETVVPGPVTRGLAVNGRIAGLRSVAVKALVSGTLVDLSVAEGDTVTRDQILMRLDRAAQQAAVRQAMAGLDSALVAQAEAAATVARTRALGANAPRVTLDTAARAEQRAGQEVARMAALLDQAQIQIDRFTLRAPIAGTVLMLAADPGQSVDPAAVLATIADLGQLVVKTDVDESYATQIAIGQPAALQLTGEAAVRGASASSRSGWMLIPAG